jgi:hypothetical protein
VDKSAALNVGPMEDCLAFPFPVVVEKEPGSTVGGLACPKNEPVCGVGGRLGCPRDSFWVAAMMVHSVVSSNSST